MCAEGALVYSLPAVRLAIAVVTVVCALECVRAGICYALEVTVGLIFFTL